MKVGRSFWTKDILTYIFLYKKEWITQHCILLNRSMPKQSFFNVCSHIWLAMVNIESFTCNTFIVIHIQILQGLIDKSMLFIIVGKLKTN